MIAANSSLISTNVVHIKGHSMIRFVHKTISPMYSATRLSYKQKGSEAVSDENHFPIQLCWHLCSFKHGIGERLTSNHLYINGRYKYHVSAFIIDFSKVNEHRLYVMYWGNERHDCRIDSQMKTNSVVQQCAICACRSIQWRMTLRHKNCLFLHSKCEDRERPSVGREACGMNVSHS